MTRFLILFLACIAVIVALAEISVRIFAGAPEFGEMPPLLDIQSPNHLIPALQTIRKLEIEANEDRFDSWVLIGDSLWFGQTMQAHGNQDWQTDTLDKQLAGLSPDAKDRFINLGMDGLLPSEILTIAHASKQSGADGVIVNIGLRSVSEDFNAPNDTSRDWLADFRIDHDGAVHWDSVKDDPLHKVAHRVSLALGNHLQSWNALRRWRMQSFGDAPAQAATTLFGRVSGKTIQLTPAPPARNRLDRLAALKAKARYRTARFDPDQSDQARAIVELAGLADPSFTVIFVYAVENPKMISRIVGETDMAEHRAELAQLINTARLSSDTPQAIHFIDDIDGLTTDHFLDLVHVDAEGYAAYARSILGHLP